jgi:ActR/RegA family two-component response regulator
MVGKWAGRDRRRVESKEVLHMSLPHETSIPTRRVLLVEDEALVAMIAADSLNDMGYDVLEVGTARAALDRAHPDCTGLDFAVIDLGLRTVRATI